VALVKRVLSAAVLLPVLCSVGGCHDLSANDGHAIEGILSTFLTAVAQGDSSSIARLSGADSTAHRYLTDPLDGRAEWARYAATHLTLTDVIHAGRDSALVYLSTDPERLRCVGAPGPNSGVTATLIRRDGAWKVLWAQLEPAIC